MRSQNDLNSSHVCTGRTDARGIHTKGLDRVRVSATIFDKNLWDTCMKREISKSIQINT